MYKKSFLGGALILGIAGLIVKVLGAFFRIPIANIIGADGMGYYQTAYPIYVFLMIISTSGIPTAISKIVSEKNAVGDRYTAHYVFIVSSILLFFIGIFTSALLFFSADFLVSNVFKNPGAYYSMLAIAPALLFVPIMSAFRGYFQGLQDMKPTAISQVIEQLFRVVAGLALAYCLFPKGVKLAAAGASFGAAAGAVMGSVAIIWIYIIRRENIIKHINKKRISLEQVREIVVRIAVIAIPITIGAAIMPIMNMIDLSIVMRRLQQSGFTPEVANKMFGQLSGLANPLINFPQVLSMSIALSLVPAISAAHERKDYDFLHYNINMGVRMSLIMGLPCALGLMTLSRQIMILLYPMQKISAMETAPTLFILAFGVIFLSTVQIFTAILQGIGKPSIPVINLLIGSIFKIVFTFILTGIPSINIKGAAIGTDIAYMLASIFNLIAIKKYTNIKFDFILTFIKPAVCALLMSAVAFVSYNTFSFYINENLATIFSILIAALAYIIILFMIKGITYEDLEVIPKSKKVTKLLHKFKL